MKKEKITLEKMYTRDNCFLVQEPWYAGHSVGANGKRNPYKPITIYYINDGMVEIWENKKSIDWYKNQVVEKNLADSSFFATSVKKYNRILDKLDVYWKYKHLKSITELRKFLKLVHLGTQYFLYHYYSGVDKRNPKSVIDQAVEMRIVDSFYDDSDRIIRETIHHLYPRISYDLGLSLIFKELSKLPSTKALEQRNKQCVFIPGSYFKAESLEKFLQSHPEYQLTLDKYSEDQSLLKGSVGFEGKVRGRVRILRIKSNIPKFKKGEILVSPMTTPVFLPAMKKSRAVVTDEGGIMCHAAIVCREFNIPCIIGTKVATKILRNGDLVEVDADKGVVRKLS